MIDDLIRLLQDLRRADERSRTVSPDAPDAVDVQREVDRLRNEVWARARSEGSGASMGDRLNNG